MSYFNGLITGSYKYDIRGILQIVGEGTMIRRTNTTVVLIMPQLLYTSK